MTEFWRNGHWRTNHLGHTFWVEGHDVNRDDWDRASTANPNQGYVDRLRELRAISSVSGRYVWPNAKCPVCGEAVFFYQNEHGSRVFFDELGPPWPKHPCTSDHSNTPVPYDSQDSGLIAPTPRTPDELKTVDNWYEPLAIDLEKWFRDRYRTRRLPLCVLVKRIRSNGLTFAILLRISAVRQKPVLVSAPKWPAHFTEGMVLAAGKKKLHWLDVVQLEAHELPIKRFGSAAAFIEALSDASNDAVWKMS